MQDGLVRGVLLVRGYCSTKDIKYKRNICSILEFMNLICKVPKYLRFITTFSDYVVVLINYSYVQPIHIGKFLIV